RIRRRAMLGSIRTTARSECDASGRVLGLLSKTTPIGRGLLSEENMPTTTAVIRFGSFGPIVWDLATGETRAATQYDLNHLPVGEDLTEDEEASIPED